MRVGNMRRRLNLSFMIFVLLAAGFAIGVVEGTLLEPKLFALTTGLLAISLLMAVYTHPYRVFVLNLESQGFLKEKGLWRHKGVGEFDLRFEGARGSLLRPMHASNYTFLFTADVRIPATILSKATNRLVGVGPIKISIGHAFSYSGDGAVRVLRRVANENAAENAGRLFRMGAVSRFYARDEDRQLVVEVVGGSGWRYYWLEPGDIELIADFFSSMKRAWSKHGS